MKDSKFWNLRKKWGQLLEDKSMLYLFAQGNIIFSFKHSVSKYYKRMVEYFCVTVIVSVLCIIVVNYISVNGVIGLILKFISAGLLSNILLFMIYCRTNRILNIYDLVRKVYRMLQSRRKGEVK